MDPIVREECLLGELFLILSGKVPISILDQVVLRDSQGLHVVCRPTMHQTYLSDKGDEIRLREFLLHLPTLEHGERVLWRRSIE